MHSNVGIPGLELAPTFPAQDTNPTVGGVLDSFTGLTGLSEPQPPPLQQGRPPWPLPSGLSSHVSLPPGPCQPCPPWLCQLSCVLGLLLKQTTAHPPVTASLFAGLPHAYHSDPVKARTLFYLILVLSPGCASLSAGELASGLKTWKELGQSSFCVLLGPNPPPPAPVPGPLRLS